MKGIDNFRQHILIIVIFQLWNICLFPFFAWIYSFYNYIYRSVDAKVAEAVHIPAHIQLKLNLVKVLNFVLAFELEMIVDKFTAKVSISTSL